MEVERRATLLKCVLSILSEVNVITFIGRSLCHEPKTWQGYPPPSIEPCCTTFGSVLNGLLIILYCPDYCLIHCIVLPIYPKEILTKKRWYCTYEILGQR